MFYIARWYDPALGRFAQADTIVPGGVQGWDRYAYANNSPIVYNDPTGHLPPPCPLCNLPIYDISSWSEVAQFLTDLAVSVVGLQVDNGIIRTPTASEGIENFGPIALVSGPMDDVADGTNKLAKQVHHFASDKHKTKWTALFDEIAKKYGVDLNGKWNKAPIPGHKGPHPDDYHQWVLKQMQDISNELGDCGTGCADQFKEMFKERVIDPVLENPKMIKKHFWE
jgi:hypothetical protein